MKRVLLIFHREELLYDIANRAYVIHDTATAPNEHAHHQIADIVEDGNVHIITRWLNLAFREAEYILYKYTHVDVDEASSLDNTYGEPQKYEMMMQVPDDFAKVSVQLIKNLIHEFLVCRALFDWLTTTNNNGISLEALDRKIEQTKQEIKNALNQQHGTIRRPLNPF